VQVPPVSLAFGDAIDACPSFAAVGHAIDKGAEILRSKPFALEIKLVVPVPARPCARTIRSWRACSSRGAGATSLNRRRALVCVQLAMSETMQGAEG
jgi:hypothetical protein